MGFFSVLVAGIIGLMAIGGVEAQTEVDPDKYSRLSFEELMDLEVTSVSKFPQKQSSAPATILVITRRQILERGYTDLSDVLKDVNGVDMVDNARGFGEYYTVRGIEGNDRFLVLVDGHKINPAIGTFLSLGNSISIQFAKQIEIIFGPASAIYGADAFAGIINIISEEPSSKPSQKIHAGYGPRHTVDNDFVTTATFSPDFSLLLTGRLFQSDGPDFRGRDRIYDAIDDYAPPLRPDFEQPIDDHTIFGKLHYKNGALGFFRQQFDEGNALGTTPHDNVHNLEYRWKLSSTIAWADYRSTFANGGTFAADLTYTRYEQDPLTQFFKVASGDQFLHQFMTGKSATVRSLATYDRAWRDNFQTVAGLEYEHTEGIPPYANDQVLGNSLKYEGENARLIDAALTITEQRYAGFGQATYVPVPWLTLIGGVRYDYSSRYKGTFNPRAGLIANPLANTTLKVLFGTAFQAPSLFYQYEQWGAATIVMLSVDEIKQSDPSWKLDNQHITTSEVSLSHQVGAWLNVHASVYHHSLKDLIERVTYTDSAFNKYMSTTDSVFSTGVRNENIGEQRITGFSLDCTTELSSHLNAYIGYSYTDAVAKTDLGDVGIPRLAKNKLWLGLTGVEIFQYLTVSGRLKWIGEMNHRNQTVFPDGKQPGYTNVDANLSINDLIKHVRFYARLENLFDDDFQYAGLYVQRGGYLPTIPNDGRSWRIGLEIKLP